MGRPKEACWSELLRQERIGHNWHQSELAEQLGASVLSVKRWERGNLPSTYFRLKLCALFGKSAQELGFAETSQPESRQKEEKTNTTQEMLPLLPTVSCAWSVPYPRNPFFTGREDILQSLHQQLSREHVPGLIHSQAISGLGGIGKTQIALEYTYRYRQDYRCVFWTNAANRETLLTDLVIIADLLQLPER